VKPENQLEVVHAAHEQSGSLKRHVGQLLEQRPVRSGSRVANQQKCSRDGQAGDGDLVWRYRPRGQEASEQDMGDAPQERNARREQRRAGDSAEAERAARR
jgi:hypothetical protein